MVSNYVKSMCGYMEHSSLCIKDIAKEITLSFKKAPEYFMVVTKLAHLVQEYKLNLVAGQYIFHLLQSSINAVCI